MKVLNDTTIERASRPVRILQFGEGNFLRAFVDWMVDIANERGVMNTSVAVVPPRFRENASIGRLRAQGGLYHVVLEGIRNGRPERTSRLIECISEVIVPETQPERYEAIITSPDFRFIISNTTEAGIRYEKDDVLSEIPATFPGKITGLLWRRWKHFNGDAEKGLVFLCCELIEDNSTTLREFINRHAVVAGLPQKFIDWVNGSCMFADTLVDRIVPGFPADNIDEVKAELQFDDNCVVKGELYHLWAIGGAQWERIREEFPLDKAGLNVLFMPEIKTFRDKKVRILNGSHTGMVPVALQMGCQSVGDAVGNEAISRFLHDMVAQEVLPMIAGDREELSAFAAGILERFYNPYIRHYLKSIALNSLSKWETRNWPTVRDYFANRNSLSEREVFTFAALFSLYGPGSGFEPEDNPEHIAAIRKVWREDDYETTVREILAAGIFNEDFEASAPGFAAKVAARLRDIREDGMEKALQKLL